MEAALRVAVLRDVAAGTGAIALHFNFWEPQVAKSRGFLILDHPADVGIEATGRNLAEAFEQAAAGLMSVILDPASVAVRVSKEVFLEGADQEHLLVKWLTEILYLYDGEKFAGREFEVVELTENYLRAVARGEPYSRESHVTRVDVKAVTYHQLLVEESGDGGRVRVFLDI
ncbi:MAG: archease [Acidobacteria bacterium]|nr:archease [Acidobacteriota bacterium]